MWKVLIMGNTQQPATDQREDALKRLNMWLERLEEQASRLLEAVEPEEVGPVHAANIAAKYIALLARLLLMRQQFAPETSSLEEQLLTFLLDGESG